MKNKYLIKEEKSGGKDLMFKTYLECDITISDFTPLEDEDKKIITIGFAKVLTFEDDGREINQHRIGKSFSFDVELKDEEHIHALVNVLFCGINNSLNHIFKNDDLNIPY